MTSLRASAAQSDLAAQSQANVSLALVGELVTWRVSVTNHGPAAAPTVTLTNWHSTNVAVFATSASRGACLPLVDGVRCDFGSLSPGTVADVILTLTPMSHGTVSLTGSVSSPNIDPIPANNSSGITFVTTPRTFHPGPNLIIARRNHAATLLADGRVLIVGGVTATGHTATAELFDPSLGSFRLTGTMQTTRDYPTATLLTNGSVLVIGGERAEIFNPVAETFSDAGPMIDWRWAHTATPFADGRVLITGGAGWSPAAEVYHPGSNGFFRVGNMLHGRYHHSATRLADGRVLIAGGSGAANWAEIYNPSSNSFAATGDMVAGNWWPTLTLLPDGKVLVAKPYGPAPNSELYDPVAGTFTALGDPSRPIKAETATLLEDGRVLVCPGLTGELYDPVTQRFTDTIPMTRSRTGFTATRLQDGKVLIVGGDETTEFYVPGEVKLLPQITILDASSAEGNVGAGTVGFPLQLSYPMAMPVQVEYFLSAGSADWLTGDIDYTNAFAVFPPGATNISINVNIRGDLNFEMDESFTIHLRSPSNAILSRAQATGTILNDDPIPTAIVSDAQSNERASVFTVPVPVILSGASIHPVTVRFSTADGTALVSADYFSKQGELSFPPGVTTQFVHVPIRGDLVIEPDETFFLTLRSASNATTGQARAAVTLINDDGLPGRLDHFEFAPIFSTQYPGRALAVEVTARDYLGNTVTNFHQRVKFRASSSDVASYEFDFESEGLEGWTPLLTGYSPGPYEIAYFDVSGDGVPSAAFRLTPDYDSPPDGLTRSVYLRGGFPYLVSSELALRNESDSPNYVAAAAQLRIGQALIGSVNLTGFAPVPGSAPELPPGYTHHTSISGSFTPTTNGYYPIEVSFSGFGGDNRFWVYADNIRVQFPPLALSKTNWFTNGVWAGEILFTNLAAGVTLEVIDTEGHSGTSVPFNLQPQTDLSVSSSVSAQVPHVGYPVTFTVAVTNHGPFTAPDIRLTNVLDGRVVILSATSTLGACSVQSNIVSCQLGALTNAGRATVTMVVSSPSTGWITNTASVSSSLPDAFPEKNTSALPQIINPAPLYMASTAVTEPDTGTTNVTVTIFLEYPSAEWISVDYATIPGTALAGMDFLATTGRVVLPPGVTTQFVTVQVLGDALDEATESFRVGISNPTNAIIAYTGTATIAITDSDLPPAVFIADTSVVEGSSGTTQAVFEVFLSTPSAQTVSASWATFNGTAIASGDYTSVANGTISFPPGATNRTLSVSVKGNTVNESNETFLVTLRSPVNATLGRATATGTILNDDAVPGQLDHFGLSQVPSPQLAGRPIPVTGRFLSNFVAGAWQGLVTISNAYPSVRFTVDDGSEHLGTNAEFAVIQRYNLALSLPAEATEGDGILSGQGRLMVTIPRTNDVGFSLTSSDETELIVPATVMLPAGQTSAVFNVSIVDDLELDGSRTASVTATAPDYATNQVILLVHDNESATLSLEFPVTLREGDGTVPGGGVLRASQAPSVDVLVSLASSDETELVLPFGVVLPAGQTSALFDFTLPDDNLLDGPQAVTATARVRNWTQGVASVVVLDNESTNLLLQLPTLVFEGQGTISNQASVRLSGLAATNVVVTFQSLDTSELEVPPSLVIPAGQTNVFFNLTIVDDALSDGRQNVMVRASSPGFGPAQAVITVGDDDLHHFSFAPIASPQTSTVPFEVTLNARDINGDLIATFGGNAALSGTGSRSNVALQYSAPAQFQNGQWTGAVTIAYWDSLIRLRATSGGVTGQSNPFDCAPPVLQVIELAGNDVAYDRFRERLYISVGAAGGTLSNRVVVVEPGVGVIESSFPVGPEPQKLALSDTGEFLYVACNGFGPGSNAVRRFALSTRTLSQHIVLGRPPERPDLAYYAWDIAPLPSLPKSVAIAKVDSLQMVIPRLEVFDDGVPRTNTLTGPIHVVAASSSRVFTGPVFARIDLNESGVSSFDSYLGYLSFPDTMKVQRGLVFTRYGRVFDPESLTILGHLPSSYWVEPDLTVGRVWCIVQEWFGPFPSYALLSCDSTRFLNLDRIPMPSVAGAPGNPVRWGTNGLAFLTAARQLALVRLPFMPEPVPADLVTTVSTTPATVDLLSNITYTVTVTNQGPNPARNVKLVDKLPTGAALVDFDGGVFSCTVSNGTITCLVPELAVGSTASLSFRVMAEGIQPAYTNTFVAVSSGVDPVPTNNGNVSVTDLVPVPVAWIEDAVMNEGNIQDRGITFRIWLTKTSPLPVHVWFRTFPGSAQGDVDFDATTGLYAVYFPPGETNGTISVRLFADLNIEPDESFTMRLDRTLYCLAGRDSAIGTIRNDDGVPGELHHFEWSATGRAVFENQPFAVEVTARDDAGNVATNFSRSVTFTTGFSNGLGINVDFQAPTLDPWVPLNAGPNPGPYGLYEFDTNGDRTPSRAFLMYPDYFDLDGIRQEMFMSSNVTYRVEVDAASSRSLPNEFGAGIGARVRIGGQFVAQESLRTRFTVKRLSGFYTPPSNGWFSVELLGNHTYRFTNPDLLFDNLLVVPNVPPPSVDIIHEGTLSNGVWRGIIRLAGPGTNVFLHATDDDGHWGRSLSFTVGDSADTDGDGLPDAWELDFFSGLDSADGSPLSDPDGDGLGNAGEFRAGTNPLDPSSAPRVQATIHSPDVELIFETIPGHRYSVEWSPQPDGPWTPLATTLLGTGESVRIVDIGAILGPVRFYRLSIAP